MARRWIRAVALLLATVLSACSGSGGRTKALLTTTTSTTTSTTTAPANREAFATDPGLADPGCNGEQGIRLSDVLIDDYSVSSTGLVDGTTLIAGRPRDDSTSVMLRSVTSRCSSNDAFGDGGAATVTVPPGLHPTGDRGPFPDGLYINAVAARRRGGAILVGGLDGRWVVAAVRSDGSLDPTFGHGGWVALPFPGYVQAAVEEPSGRIVIAGSEGSGCCVHSSAAAISADGRLDTHFGDGGRTTLPSGLDSGVGPLMIEPNGDILAEVGYGHMGCWGTALAMLLPSGRPKPGFEPRLDRFWKDVDLSAFMGRAFVQGDGFTIVGSGQQPCAQQNWLSDPSATGLLSRFRGNGELAVSTTRFPRPPYFITDAFPDGEGCVLIGSPYDEPERLTIVKVGPDERVGGGVHVDAPAVVGATTFVSVHRALDGAFVLVAAVTNGGGIHVIRVRI